MGRLEISTEIFEQMIKQAKSEAPIEACGILAGRDNKVEKLYEMSNVDNSCDHFMMKPEEQFAAVKDIRSAGLEMLAICHSHPATPATPSAEDIRLSLTPGVVYVILSLQDTNKPQIRGFTVQDRCVTEVPVKVI